MGKKLVIFDFSSTLAGKDGVYHGMVDQLQELKANGWTLAIASLASRDEIVQELDEVFTDEGKPMTSLFDDHIYGSDDGKKSLRKFNSGRAIKHSKETVNGILRDTGADRRQTIVVGDAFTELLMARNGHLKYLHAGWDDRAKQGLSCAVGLDAGIDEVDVAMAQSVPAVEQLSDRLEAEIAPKKAPVLPETAPER